MAHEADGPIGVLRHHLRQLAQIVRRVLLIFPEDAGALCLQHVPAHLIEISVLPLLQLLLQLIALRDDTGDAGVQIQMRDRQRRACLIEHLITPRDIIQQLIAARIVDTDAPRALLEADDLQHLQIAKRRHMHAAARRHIDVADAHEADILLRQLLVRTKHLSVAE